MIKFENVTKIWPNGMAALKDVNLNIEIGDFVAVIGLSGAGKTTLLKTINKMTDITLGNITVVLENKDKIQKYSLKKLYGRKLRKFRNNIGWISQDYTIIPTQTVLRNVLNGRIVKMSLLRSFFLFFNKNDKIIALTALDKLKILNKSYARADSLSGGQQQRIALARVMSQEPKIIIADEPVSALDPILANQVMNDLLKLNQQEKITVIINLHNVELALKYANKIIGIKEGRVVFNDQVNLVNETILKNIYGDDY